MFNKTNLYQLFKSCPHIKFDYPVNLSILLTGGKETNWDSLSKGDWIEKSSKLKSIVHKRLLNCSFMIDYYGCVYLE